MNLELSGRCRIKRIPNDTKKLIWIGKEDSEACDTLEDDDDVQNVYHIWK